MTHSSNSPIGQANIQDRMVEFNDLCHGTTVKRMAGEDIAALLLSFSLRLAIRSGLNLDAIRHIGNLAMNDPQRFHAPIEGYLGSMTAQIADYCNLQDVDMEDVTHRAIDGMFTAVDRIRKNRADMMGDNESSS